MARVRKGEEGVGSVLERAMERVRERVEAVPLEQAVRRSVSLAIAGKVVLGVVRRVRAGAVWKRLERLGVAGEFELGLVDRLEDLGRAAMWVSREADRERSMRSDRRVSVELLGRAKELRARMERVVEFQLLEERGVLRELEVQRRGRGYEGMVEALQGLAGMYERYRKELRGVPKHYDAGDALEARRVVDAMVRGISERRVKGEMGVLGRRVLALLVRDYEELRAVLGFLWRGDAGAMRVVPTLGKASGTGRVRGRSVRGGVK